MKKNVFFTEIGFAVTVDAVEAATGLNFFSVVSQPKQEQLESTISVQDWQWKRRK